MNHQINHPTLAILEPSGYITAANVGKFQQLLKETVNQPLKSSILVDMSRVEFLDSAGLMALASAFRLAQSLGKKFSICALAPSVRIIFELTQLDRAFDIFEDWKDFETTLNRLAIA